MTNKQSLPIGTVVAIGSVVGTENEHAMGVIIDKEVWEENTKIVDLDTYDAYKRHEESDPDKRVSFIRIFGIRVDVNYRLDRFPSIDPSPYSQRRFTFRQTDMLRVIWQPGEDRRILDIMLSILSPTHQTFNIVALSFLEKQMMRDLLVYYLFLFESKRLTGPYEMNLAYCLKMELPKVRRRLATK